MNSYKEVNAKNLKKGVMYFIKQKNETPVAAYFDKDESVKYLRFKYADKTPVLIKKNSKFYYPHKNNSKRNNNSTRKNNNNNNSTRRTKHKRVEFEPTSVSNWN